MGIDWSYALLVGGMGFGMVFFLLIVLAVFIWLTGRIFNRASFEKGKKDKVKEGA